MKILLQFAFLFVFGIPAELMAEKPLMKNSEFLEVTRYIDYENPAIRETVEELTKGSSNDIEKAVRIHDFVRDEIGFGWAAEFYDQKASEVLRSGIGFCNTKGTLFVAMLRAAGIPARQHFVNINATIISDFISPGTSYVDHSYTEVFLADRWIAVDSYIVDLPLFIAAKSKLENEGRILGYGIHAQGSPYWDGRTDSYSQYFEDGDFKSLTTTDHGVFSDVGTFYKSGQGLNKLGFIERQFFRLARNAANRKIDALRVERDNKSR